MKSLPEKWKTHIKKMTEYSQKANSMREELEKYLISKGLVNENNESKCSFEDSIIDIMSHAKDDGGDYTTLIKEIELALNGEFDKYIDDIIEKRITSNSLPYNQGLNGWLSPTGIFTEFSCSEIVNEDKLYNTGWINFIYSKRNMQEYVFFKPMENLTLKVTTEQVNYINDNFNRLTEEQQQMAKMIITDYI